MTSSAAERPTVSVVIPVKDDARQLEECLAALHRQTRRPDEIIVVDNASDDDSARVARAAGAVVTRCDQPGIPAAAGHGYDTASGDLVLRLDADCRPDPTWVSVIVAEFDRPDVSVVTGWARFRDGPRLLRAPLAGVYLGAYALAGIAALGHLPLFGSNLAFRRGAWAEVRHHVHRSDPELHDDLDLSFHLGVRHRIRVVRGAALGISMRPFADPRAFGRRFGRGVRTVVRHWPDDFPPRRWSALARRRAARRAPLPEPEAAG